MLDRFAPYSLSVLRIVAGLTFFLHGPQKLFGYPSSPRPAPELFSVLGAAVTLEIMGGALRAVGLFPWPVPSSCSG